MDYRNRVDPYRILWIKAFPKQRKRFQGIRQSNCIFSELQRSNFRITCKVAVGNKADAFTDASDCLSHFSMAFAICAGHSGIFIDVKMFSLEKVLIFKGLKAV